MRFLRSAIGICLAVLCVFESPAFCEEETDGRNTNRSARATDDDGDSLSQLRNLMAQSKTEDGTIDLNILLQETVIDPVPIKDFNVSNSGMFTNVKGHFTNVKLHGLKQFRLERIEVNLAKMNLSANMFIPLLSVVGDYALTGSLTFMKITGEGGFWMNLSSIAITGHSMFHANDDGMLEMGDIKLQSQVGDIQLHFENLMGGGTWSTISNSLLNQLSELILDELKHSLLRELGNFLRTQFNDHLFPSLPTLMNSGSTNIVDSVLSKAAEMIMENHLDPFPMPDLERKFERRFFFSTVRGELSLTNGYLHGLTSIGRRGDVIIVLANSSIMFEASFGFDNLTATYDWETKVFDVGPEGVLEVQVKSIDGVMRYKQDLTAGSKLHLDAFEVKDIRQIWIDIGGLGTWGYVVEIITNLASNGLKMQLADAIAGPVKENIQKQIDSLNLHLTEPIVN